MQFRRQETSLLRNLLRIKLQFLKREGEIKKAHTELKVTVDERGIKMGNKIDKKFKTTEGEIKVIDTNKCVIETPRFAGLIPRGTPGTNLQSLPRSALRGDELGSRERGETSRDEMNTN